MGTSIVLRPQHLAVLSSEEGGGGDVAMLKRLHFTAVRRRANVKVFVEVCKCVFSFSFVCLLFSLVFIYTRQSQERREEAGREGERERGRRPLLRQPSQFLFLF